MGTFKCPDQHFATVHVDIIGPLAHCQGSSNVLTIIDCFTQWPEAISITDVTAVTCAQALLMHWIAHFGIPEDIISDQGWQFTATCGLNCATYSAHCIITPQRSHPQCNGMIERFDR